MIDKPIINEHSDPDQVADAIASCLSMKGYFALREGQTKAKVCRILFDQNGWACSWEIVHPNGDPRLSVDILNHFIWERSQGRSKRNLHALPRDERSAVVQRLSTRLPLIKRVFRGPIATQSGIITPGNAGDGVGTVGPPIEEVDTIEEARELLSWALTFPFTDDSDFLHALSILLTPAVAPLLRGPAPLFVVTGASGVGKTTLLNVLAALWNERIGVMPLQNGQERLYTLSAQLAKEPIALLLDNVSIAALEDENLKSWITTQPTRPITIRPTGTKGDVTANAPVFWAANGLSFNLGREMERRVIKTRLRSEFGYTPESLPVDVAEKLPKLFGAILFALKGWTAAGRPQAPQEKGGFTSWSLLAGGLACWLFPDKAEAWLTPSAPSPALTVELALEEGIRRLHTVWPCMSDNGIARPVGPKDVLDLITEHVIVEILDYVPQRVSKSPTGLARLSSFLVELPAIDGIRFLHVQHRGKANRLLPVHAGKAAKRMRNGSDLGWSDHGFGSAGVLISEGFGA